MGGDGGSTKRRTDHVDIHGSVMGDQTGRFKAFDHNSMRQSSKKHQTDDHQSLLDRAQTCTLTQEPLEARVVCCSLGMLYNKDPLLRALLNKNLPPELQHIQSLKAVFEVSLHNNPERPCGGNTYSVPTARFMCPLAQLPMNGRYRFVAIRTTGGVVSERGLKEVGSDGTCPATGHPFNPTTDLVQLHPAKLRAVNPTNIEQSNHRKQCEGNARSAAAVVSSRVVFRASNPTSATGKIDVWKSLFLNPKRKRSRYENAAKLLMAAGGSRSSQMSAV